MGDRKFGKTVRLFLMDGEADGRWSCELSNWTGKAYKIPRSMVSDSKDRKDLDTTGVYLLFGRADSSSEKNRVYIGEAESLYGRLKQHLSGKDFWNEVIVFFSKDEHLNKAHIKYLESRLYEVACNIGRYEVINSVKPTQSRVSEADQSELEEFISHIKLLTSILGHKVFEPLISEQQKVDSNTLLLIKGARGAEATGMQVADGFLVLKGSKAALEIAPAFKKHNYLKLRESLIASGTLVASNGELIFESEYLFSTPSAAAAIVMGRSANGLTEWKTNKGQSLKNIEEEK